MNAADTYQRTCVRCHGADGQGSEPAAPGEPPPRNFADAAWQSSLSNEAIASVVRDGLGPMPAFGDVLSDEEIEAAVLSVRGFARSRTE